MSNIMMSAADVAAALQISKSKAYVVIRDCNEQLKKDGYLTFAGKVPRAFLMSRIYGGGDPTNG